MRPGFVLFSKDRPDDNPDNNNNKNALYRLLETPNDTPVGGSEFFYNDEVISHLHGYVFLVATLAAQDEIFFLSFALLAGAAATATQLGQLPANPRVPALVAVATMLLTLALMEITSMTDGWPRFLTEVRPTDQALSYEVFICALNAAWGLAGPWRTKEKVSGATMGLF